MGDLFITGFEKCGTTSLYNILKTLDLFSFPQEKEPLFFESSEYHPAKYNSIFKETKPSLYRVNARPNNAIIPYVVPRIRETCEDPKFVFMVREPIERSYSGWNNWRRMRPGRDKPTYRESIEANLKSYHPTIDRFQTESEWVPYTDHRGGSYCFSHIENGEYYRHISRFIKEFGRESVYIMEMSELNFSHKIHQMLCWLGIEGCYAEPMHSNGSTSRITTQEISSEYPDIFEALYKIYYHDNLMLGKLINKDFLNEWYYWRRSR